MKANRLGPELQVELFAIGASMKTEGLSDEFIANAFHVASEFEGVCDLMWMWRDESDAAEREQIVADIQDLIDDSTRADAGEAPYVRFNDLDTIAKDTRSFKDGLLVVVTQKGGIKKLSELSGIPQPSLSRFFNSTSMPRRATLQKIAKAVGLDAVKIVTEWSR